MPILDAGVYFLEFLASSLQARASGILVGHGSRYTVVGALRRFDHCVDSCNVGNVVSVCILIGTAVSACRGSGCESESLGVGVPMFDSGLEPWGLRLQAEGCGLT